MTTDAPRPVLVISDSITWAQSAARAVRGLGVFSRVAAPGATPATAADAGAAAVVLATAADPEIADRWGAAGLPVLAVGAAYEPLRRGLAVEVGAGGVPLARDPARRLVAAELAADHLATGPGAEVLRAFLTETAGIAADWTAEHILAAQVEAVRAQVGSARLICGLSGGVDSAVAAAIVQRAVGDQLTCVFVDHGLLRAAEREQVERDFVAATGVRLVTVDATEAFLAKLAGVTEPERKRKIIGAEFIRTFEAAAAEVAASAGEPVRFLVQGTIYPDVVESLAADGGLAVKSHHNVGGLPEDLDFELVEPLRDLFKDEVRLVGRLLGLPPELVDRHPFPGPGLGVRLIGAIDAERLAVLRAADAIVREELARAGADRTIWQCPVVLLADVRSVGVSGGVRTYGMPVALRPVLSQDAMTASWARLDYDLLDRIATRITAEVDEVTRVVLDITNKPPGTIEWE